MWDFFLCEPNGSFSLITDNCKNITDNVTLAEDYFSNNPNQLCTPKTIVAINRINRTMELVTCTCEPQGKE